MDNNQINKIQNSFSFIPLPKVRFVKKTNKFVFNDAFFS